MPLYGSSTPITLNAGSPVMAWNAETLTLPANSKSVAIGLRRNANAPNCLSVEVLFGAAPGAFQIDLEVADTDADAYYVMKVSLTTVSAGQVGRLEVPSLVAKFARLRMVTRTNSVAATAKFF